MGGSSSSSSGPVEAPNSLISDSLLKITDLLCEGPISGFAYMGGAYGYDPLTATFFNDVVARNIDGSYNFNASGQGFAFAWTLGEANQLPMSGFEYVTCQVPLPPDTRLSNPPVNAGLPKQLMVTFNTSQYPDASSVLISFRIPTMYAVDSKGNTNGFEVDAQIDCSLNGFPFEPLSQPIAFVGKNTTPYFRTYQFTLPVTTPPQSFYQWSLRIYKTSIDIMSSMVASEIYVDSIAVISASQYNYPNSALVGLYIDALQFGSVPSRSYLIQGLLISVPNGYTPTQYTPGITFTRQFDINAGDGLIGTLGDLSSFNGIYSGISVAGSVLSPGTIVTEVHPDSPSPGPDSFIGIKPNAIGTDHNATLTFSAPSFLGNTATAAVYPDVWDGTFQAGVWTDNPAWIFYDLCTNPRYGLGKYINTANIDIWTLYQLSQYCDEMVDNGQGLGILEPQFTCNVFIREPEDAYNALLNMASVFRGMLYYGNGTIRANPTDNKSPVFNYTNANVINGFFSYSSTARSARHNAIQVKYTDVNNLYRDNYVLIEDNPSIQQYGYNKKDIAAFACASVGQATRVANWIMTTERLRTETVNFEVGQDSLYLRPGDVFYLYDNFRMNKNQGGRVVAFDSTQQYITLDRPVNLDSGCIYSLSCLVADFNIDTTGQITGSNQIPFLRNPQIQSREVLNADLSGLSTLQVNTSFSGLMTNAVWVLSATGVYTPNYVPTVFEQAPLYECLTIVESSPGIMGIVALNYNTGINYSVNTGFTTIMNPIQSGNSVAPLPVTNFTGNLVTGILSNQSFYTYLNLTWNASLSSDVSYYTLSGNAGGPFTQIGTTTSTGFAYLSANTGVLNFSCSAVGKGGGISAAQTTSFDFPGAPGVDPAQIRFWLLPDGFGDLEQVAVFYNRPAPSVTNTRVFFATGDAAPFTEVLDQDFYAVEGVSISGLSASGTTAYFQTNSFDAPPTLVSQGAIQQANNTLLFLLEDELMSVGPVTGLANNQYAFSMSRGVLGTFANTHTSNLSGWMFYSADINSFHDDSLVAVFNTTGYSTGVATRYFQIENNTATLQGSIVPPAPGLSYILPDPTPTSPNSLTATVGTGKIVQLNWTGPDQTNIIQYNIYRATGPGYSDRSLIGTDLNTHYNDISVTEGVTYEYWVTTISQDEEESPFSSSVFATPTIVNTSGINFNTPVNPSPLTVSTTGSYFGQDGTLYSYINFNVPATPTGAAFTNIVYTKHGVGSLVGGTIGAQLSNTGGSVLATVFDLTPNVSYDFGSQSVSNFGLFSNIVLATNSPFIGAATNPVAGQPGSPPNQPSGVFATGGLGGAANFIQVSWKANAESNLEEYGVYRNIVNTPPANPLAFVSVNSFVDALVTGNTTYFYWVSAFNRSEQQSPISTSVNAITQQAPPAPTAITLVAPPNGSGYYNAKDGTVLIDFLFNVPALTANAVGQQLVYGTDGVTWSVANDLTNTVPATSRVNDLTPGKIYYFGLETYSLNGATSAITPSSPASYLTPSKNVFTRATPPTNVQAGAPVPNSAGYPFAIPANFESTSSVNQIFGVVTGSWTASTDSDIVFYEFTQSPTAPIDSATVNYVNTVPSDQGYALYYSAINTPESFWVRAINSSQGTSVWTQSNTTPTPSTTYAGTLGGQNYDNAQLSALQTGPVTVSSVTRSLVEAMIRQTIAVTTAGGGTQATASGNINISSLGFNVVPDVGTINLDGASHGASYRYGQSSSNTAVITVYRYDGTADITNGETFNISAYFEEYT